MKYTVSARLHSRANKDNTRSVLVILYFNGEKSTYPAGLVIPEAAWDSDKQLVKVSYPGSVEFNAEIQSIQLQLHTVMEDFGVAELTPTHAKIKELYAAAKTSAAHEKLKADLLKADTGKLNLNVARANNDDGDLVSDFMKVQTFDTYERIAADMVAHTSATKPALVKRLEKAGIYKSNEQETAERKQKSEHFRQMQKEYLLELKQTGAVKQSTYKHKSSLFNVLDDFEQATNYHLSFDKMGFEFYSKFADWVLVKEDNFDSYFGSLVKRLRTWLSWCVDERSIAVNPQFRSNKFKARTETIDVVYLKLQELEWLDEFRHHASFKQERWGKVVDIALVQASIGCRYSDIVTASWYFEDGFLKGHTIKNKSTYLIPLKSSKWFDILKQYNMTFALPVRHSNKVQVLSEVKFNKYIKEVLQAMYASRGLHMEEHEKLVKKRTKLGVASFERHYKWEMISSHSMRRSFVSRMVRAGYKVEEVAKMIGTRSLEELRKYFQIEEEDLLATANRIHQ